MRSSCAQQVQRLDGLLGEADDALRREAAHQRLEPVTVEPGSSPAPGASSTKAQTSAERDVGELERQARHARTCRRSAAPRPGPGRRTARAPPRPTPQRSMKASALATIARGSAASATWCLAPAPVVAPELVGDPIAERGAERGRERPPARTGCRPRRPARRCRPGSRWPAPAATGTRSIRRRRARPTISGVQAWCASTKARARGAQRFEVHGGSGLDGRAAIRGRVRAGRERGSDGAVRRGENAARAASARPQASPR